MTRSHGLSLVVPGASVSSHAGGIHGGAESSRASRRPEQLADLATKYGDRVRTVALDVTDPAAARSAVQTAVDAFGGLDVVVNNAGDANTAPFEEMTDDEFRQELETNLFGVVNVTRAALPVLPRQCSGHFLQFSSIGGRVGGHRVAATRRRSCRGGASPRSSTPRVQTARRQGDHRRAGRLPHRVGWLVDGIVGRPGLRGDGRQDEPLSCVNRRQVAR